MDGQNTEAESPVKRMGVFLPTWVGDAVMATAALKLLRTKYSDSEITLIGSPAAIDVLADSQLCDWTIVDPGKKGFFKGFLRAVQILRRANFDMIVMFSNSFRVGLEAFLAGADKRVGYARDGRGWMLTDKLTPAKNSDGSFTVVPALDYYLALAESCGCDTSDKSMTLGVGKNFADEADTLFDVSGITDGDRAVIINPGASFGSSKLWAAERFGELADRLMDNFGVKIIINAAPGEGEIGQAVEDAMKNPVAINFARRENSLGLLKAITARSALMVTGDTGPRHIAAALGCRVVTIFGSTDPDWTTIDCPCERIIVTDADCAPCQQKTCPLPEGSGHHICMKSISVDRVYDAAAELLGGGSDD